MTLTLIERDWMSALELEFRSRPQQVVLICPFIKQPVISALLRFWKPAELRVLTRFRIADFVQGASDVAALRSLMAAGASIRGVKGLHAKVYLFERRSAFVGSANLTRRGLNENPEFGCRLTDQADLEACWTYAEDLWSAAGGNATSDQLNAWDEEVSDVLDRVCVGPDSLTPLPDYGAPLRGNPDDGEEGTAIVASHWEVESARAFIKFFGQGSNRATHDLPVITELKRTGAHWAATYPRRPRSVSDGDVLYLARLARNPTDILIFGRAIGRRHVEGDDDATPYDIEMRPFKSRWRYYVRVHHPTFIAGTIDHGVSLNALIHRFGAGSFATTEANHRNGHGNINPRRAYARQPAVRLTRASAQWLEQEFGQSVRRHGILPTSELRQLDWPAD